MKLLCTKILTQSSRSMTLYKAADLTHFFPMFSFDPPENIRKPKVF